MLLQNITRSAGTSGLSIMSYFVVTLPGSQAERQQKLEIQPLNLRTVKAIRNMRV